MARFILLTFGFLGWVFFEMSGGTGFDPQAFRLARAAEADTAENTRLAMKTETYRPAPKLSRRQQPMVTQAAFTSNTSTRASITPASLNLTTRTQVQKAVLTDTEPMNASADTSEIILPSMITPNDNATVQNVALTTETRDLRIVSGNRVNVRGGPGTKYSVVNKLNSGEEVEILRDGGNGWVKLRPVDGGPVGWMADFLLASR